MLLFYELPRGHVPYVEGINLLAGYARVLDCPQSSLDSDLSEGLVPQLAELRLTDPDDGYVSHLDPSARVIFPLNFAYVA